jgi:hypothetical protein
MIMCTTDDTIPMWPAWNSRITVDPLPQQTVCYLQNISLPPTRLDVVVETLRIAQSVAVECNERCALVTYDLAIAKPAYQIQAQEAPMFDNVFIMFGAFHIMNAYFSCLGFYIDGSGGDTIMIDTEVLASGSVNGFLLGKHYNRCKRLHPLLSLAFQSLHFKRFLEVKGPVSGDLLNMLEQVADHPSPELFETLEQDHTFLNFVDMYDDFTKKTREGELGATAAYWIKYIDMVEVWLLFSRACRTNDVDLFVYALHLMVPLFFACNKHNYARWMTMFVLHLVNMDKSHPGLRQILSRGALSVRRTHNNLSRNPIDMTLEQTINADAASRLTGIASF